LLSLLSLLTNIWPEQTRLRLKFDLIAKAIEFLGDPSEKAKYDNILKARHANKVRHAKQDTERRAARDGTVGCLKLIAVTSCTWL
jgi:curved DNA-binding protein CbpA